jgi:hypothetical protein
MKKYLLLLTFISVFLFSFSSCRKPQPEYVWDGTITGPDYRKCACCGGWFITIDNDEYTFWSVPAGSNLDLEKETFPLKVRLDWKKIEEPCLYNRIEVVRIKKK